MLTTRLYSRKHAREVSMKLVNYISMVSIESIDFNSIEKECLQSVFIQIKTDITNDTHVNYACLCVFENFTINCIISVSKQKNK